MRFRISGKSLRSHAKDCNAVNNIAIKQFKRFLADFENPHPP